MEHYLISNPDYFIDKNSSPACGTAAVQGDTNATWQEKDQDCYDNKTATRHGAGTG